MLFIGRLQMQLHNEQKWVPDLELDTTWEDRYIVVIIIVFNFHSYCAYISLDI